MGEDSEEGPSRCDQTELSGFSCSRVAGRRLLQGHLCSQVASADSSQDLRAGRTFQTGQSFPMCPLRKHPVASPQLALSQPGSWKDLETSESRTDLGLPPHGTYGGQASRRWSRRALLPSELSLLKILTMSKSVCAGARRVHRCPQDSHNGGVSLMLLMFGENHCSLSRNRTHL